HRIRTTVEIDRFADDVRIRSEASSPKPITQRDDLIAAFLFFFRQKLAPEHRSNAHQSKEIRCDQSAANRFRLAYSREAGIPRRIHGQILKDVILTAPIEEIRIGSYVLAYVLMPIVYPDHSELLRLRIWKRTQYNAVDYSKYRAVCAYAD